MVVKLNPPAVVSHAQAQAIVERMAPGRRVIRVSELQGGEISAVFEIILEGDAPSWVIKVYSESMHWKMQKEVTVSRLLEGRLTVPVARILFADDTKSLLDLNFTVMKKLGGDRVMELDASLTPPEQYAIYKQMGQVLREIHGCPMEAFGYIGPHGVSTPHASNRAYMSFQFGRKLAEFIERRGPATLARRLGALVEQRAPLLDACATPSLCHYDFHTGNILAERRDGTLTLSGVLDLENAIAGDPLMDIAKTLNYSARGDETKKAGLLAGYGAIDRPAWQETLVHYELYGLLELWCWWAQIGDNERAASLLPALEGHTRAV